jgi:hypothetical protein
MVKFRGTILNSAVSPSRHYNYARLLFCISQHHHHHHHHYPPAVLDYLWTLEIATSIPSH